MHAWELLHGKKALLYVRIERAYKYMNYITMHLCMHYSYTSGKNFIKITSVGMGAAKSNETR